MMRRLAASIGYGVGKHTQTIMQNADELEVFNLVVSTGPPKEERCVIKADAGFPFHFPFDLVPA